jgi:hypothetical protein
MAEASGAPAAIEDAPLHPPPAAPPPVREAAAPGIDLGTELRNALEFPLKGFDVRLRELTYNWTVDGLSVSGRFHYLAFKDGKPSVEDFVDYIYGRIAYFCLPRKERKKQLERFQKENDWRYLQEAIDKARDLLIRAKEQQKTLGEPGELILFILLEAVLHAPMMACKMYLKTSQEMPVHGTDGIHMSFDPDTQTLTLYWGESKIYADLHKALDEVCASISAFIAEKDGKVPRRRDIDILKDHMDMENGPVKDAILAYLDPFDEWSNKLREVYACFVGFDFSFFTRLPSYEQAAVEEAFRNEYLDRVESACKLFADKIRANGLSQLTFHFFLVPFPSVATLRKLHLGKLGVKDD